MKKRSGLYLWADERLDGQLADLLAQWRTEELSFDQIVQQLAEHDLTVSRETVRRWVKAAA